jgi:hypothetical protein
MDDARKTSSGYNNVEELGLVFIKLEGGLTLDIIDAWAIHRNECGLKSGRSGISMASDRPYEGAYDYGKDEML